MERTDNAAWGKKKGSLKREESNSKKRKKEKKRAKNEGKRLSISLSLSLSPVVLFILFLLFPKGASEQALSGDAWEDR